MSETKRDRLPSMVFRNIHNNFASQLFHHCRVFVTDKYESLKADHSFSNFKSELLNMFRCRRGLYNTLNYNVAEIQIIPNTPELNIAGDLDLSGGDEYLVIYRFFNTSVKTIQELSSPDFQSDMLEYHTHDSVLYLMKYLRKLGWSKNIVPVEDSEHFVTESDSPEECSAAKCSELEISNLSIEEMKNNNELIYVPQTMTMPEDFRKKLLGDADTTECEVQVYTVVGDEAIMEPEPEQ